MMPSDARPVDHAEAGGHALRLWSAAVRQLPLDRDWRLLVALSVLCVAAAAMRFSSLRISRNEDDGFAARRQVRAVLGSAALHRRAATLRPEARSPTSRELGVCLGRSRGVQCWASIEDSVMVVGPPRSGKGMHLAIPMILDAPGAVITTSTRPDNLATTLRSRVEIGPTAIFDPQRLAASLDSRLRWSPVRGCEDPAVAMTRARALCADAANGVTEATFWQQQAVTATRCLLHAAALAERKTVDLLRWSLSVHAAQQAVDILASHPAAAQTWTKALDGILDADPRQRDAVWATVANVFSALSDPTVLDALSPGPGEHFDPAQFLQERGTLYLIGTASGAAATATMVAAFVEDVIDAAKRQAARSPGGRLDPPLALVLDEAANYPLPSLPSLMSDGGGAGISTTVILQSLAQARSRWGPQDAAAIWDSAIIKVVLGGLTNASDLSDISGLTGKRTERQCSESRGPDGRRSISTSTHDVATMDVGQLRTLPFGRALLLPRSTAPLILDLRPWTKRRDAARIQEHRAGIERQLRTGSKADG
ncbi:MAG: TraM recognition domain-containing protein [Actinomycetota bacterium]|nr:TraM recognition domain-containing protein [Actinomycetota bacterium]